jgi:hypothetical protein
LRAKVAGQRIPCSFLWVGLVRWALAKGSPTDYIMYITVLYWGGWWTLECIPHNLRAVKMRKRDAQTGWTRRSCSMLCQSIESHERGGTDKMDVTRVLDPLDLSRCVESRLHARQSLQACTVCVINGSSRPGCSLRCRYEDEPGIVSGPQHAESLTFAICSLRRLCLKGR